MLLTIGEAAVALGVCVVTLRRWDKCGLLKPHLRTAGGHRRYLLAEAFRALGVSSEDPAPQEQKLVVGYARVSSHDQNPDLDRQLERLRTHLKSEPCAFFLTDLGSGLNFKKRGCLNC